MPEYSQSTIHMRVARIEKILAERIAMAGDERQRMRGECGAHGFGLAHHVVITGGQGRHPWSTAP